jgi:hypothetical protein
MGEASDRAASARTLPPNAFPSQKKAEARAEICGAMATKAPRSWEKPRGFSQRAAAVGEKASRGAERRGAAGALAPQTLSRALGRFHLRAAIAVIAPSGWEWLPRSRGWRGADTTLAPRIFLLLTHFCCGSFDFADSAVAFRSAAGAKFRFRTIWDWPLLKTGDSRHENSVQTSSPGISQCVRKPTDRYV